MHILIKKTGDAYMNVNDDTIKLLRECDAGVEMGIKTLDNVIDDVDNDELRKILEKSKETHCRLKGDIAEKLSDYGDDGKEPAAMASFFAKVKSEVKLMSEHPDVSAAELIIDGCNMGIRSIYKYFNKYPAADVEIKRLVDDIVKEEEDLSVKLRKFL